MNLPVTARCPCCSASLTLTLVVEIDERPVKDLLRANVSAIAGQVDEVLTPASGGRHRAVEPLR